jgi:GMP synthase (glutamine-hydrolysing)
MTDSGLSNHDLSKLRLLLIQVRESPDVARHERASLMDITGLRDSQIDAINVVENPEIDWKRIDRVHAVVIGGAGVHSATADAPFTPVLADAVKKMVDTDVPLFGSCYGHQFMARFLGGEVVTDRSRSEVGTIDVTLTPHGAADRLFGHCPERFPVLMGHNDRVTTLPPGATELASSAVCDNQAFRLDGFPVWGTQFHSELSPDRLVERLTMYAKVYAPDEEEFARIKRALRPTPEAEQLLHRFLAMAMEHDRSISPK